MRQITGDSHFNEVFLTEVWIPDEAVVGDVGGGWAVANTMLLSERGTFGEQATSDFDDVVALAQRTGRAADRDIRQEIATLYGRDQAIRLLRLETRTALSKGTSAPMIPSITKLLTGARNRRLADLALSLLGTDAVVTATDDAEGRRWQQRFLMAPVSRIAGGTDEIQRNILGERFLGLPKELRQDKDVAFDDVPKA